MSCPLVNRAKSNYQFSASLSKLSISMSYMLPDYGLGIATASSYLASNGGYQVLHFQCWWLTFLQSGVVNRILILASRRLMLVLAIYFLSLPHA
jgi:hypothetical protein